jgi:hypothetical protein
MADNVLGHRRPRDVDAQFLELPVNSRRAPEEIGFEHPSNEPSDLRGGTRVTGRFRRTRWHDGRVWLWLGVRKQT